MGDRAPWRKRLEQIEVLVTHATDQFDAIDPAKCAATPTQGLAATRRFGQDVEAATLPTGARYDLDHGLGIKEEQFNLALVQSLGVSVDSFTRSSHLSRRSA
jgi:hypothetical protein